MTAIAVYLGARAGEGKGWTAAAALAGRTIARQGHTLVYGGGRLGLMGVVADAALAEGGRVVGVIPRSMVDREQAHPGLHENHIVGSMHERKAMLTELSDAFLILPGGFGTMDELFEAVTWRQLEIHRKPIALWSVDGYYARLWEFLEDGRRLGFMPSETLDAMTIDHDLAVLLSWLTKGTARTLSG